jgi:enoyl-CoA hydratase
VPVHYEERGHVALITIDRPDRRGAMDFPHYDMLADCWRRAFETPTVRVAVLTGVGDSYCAGADLKSLIPEVASRARESAASDDATPTPEPEPTAEAGEQPLPGGTVAVLRNIEFMNVKPIIAAVNGPCVASGMEMLLGTDIRYASPNAVFGLPEVCRGLFASGGSTVRLPRQVPFVHAMDILLTGRYLTADEAAEIGLINKVVPKDQLLDTAFATAELIAANSPGAVQGTKRSVLMGLGMDRSDAYDFEQDLGQKVFAGADAIEGPKAFLEKRAPVWEDV